MKKIYYLSTCDTCARILKEVNPPKSMELIDIKANNIDEATLDFLAKKEGSYESLFSKRALKFRSMGLHEMKLTEADYKKYMLEEYTFLRRPFFIYDDTVFIGNAPKTVEAAVKFFKELK